MDVGEEKRGEGICTCRRPGRTTGSPSFPPPMPPKRLNRFGGKKSVADLCGSRNWTAGAVDNLIPAIYSKRTLLARLCALSHPLLPLPSPSPMFVLQSLNHLTTSAAAGRVRECVSGSGRGRERGGRLSGYRPTDRVRTASSSRIECGVRPSRTPSCKSPANPCLEVTRTQGSDSFPSFLPPAVVVQYDHVPDSCTNSAPGGRP